MALDHTRDFFTNAHFSPTDLDRTWPALFLTRWITHFCAPTFVFLAGTSAYLWASKQVRSANVSGFLLKRGLLLIVLTCTVEAWAWNFHHDFREIHGGVLWAIGWSMVALAGLARLRLLSAVMLGGLMIAFHNAFDLLKAADLGEFGLWWAILHSGEEIRFANGWLLDPFYPLVPWIGVMAVGYGFGKLLSLSQWRTRNRLLVLGLSLIIGFLLLRFMNVYGDPKPWQTYPDPAFTVLSFINCHKYPPSLLYLLMTLGPAVLFLGITLNWPARRYGFLQLFGRTPLFYYLIHLYLIHLLALAVAAIDSGPVAALAGSVWSPEMPKDYGYGLPMVYAMWLLLLPLLYWLCRSFEAFKARKPHWRWLGYF